jgi:hypothetical protein
MPGIDYYSAVKMGDWHVSLAGCISRQILQHQVMQMLTFFNFRN